MKKKIVQSFLLLLIFSTMTLPAYATESKKPTKRIQDISSFGSAALFNAINNIEGNHIASNNPKVNVSYKKIDKIVHKSNSLIGTMAFANVQNFVYVRTEPNIDSEVAGKMYTNAACEILDVKDDWYQIKSGSIESGWTHKDYLYTGDEADEIAKLTGTKYARVNTTTLRVRKEANLDSEVLGLIPIEEELIIMDETDEWVKVSIENGDGWVSKEYVDIRTEYIQAESKAEEEARLAKEEKARQEAARAAEQARKAKEAENKKQEETKNITTTESNKKDEAQESKPVAPTSSNGQAVVNYAAQFLGNPYVYGGSSLTNGADCSGFIMSVYANFGISLPHSSTALRSVGYGVSLSEAQPGDIICYSGHATIYCGNNTVIHASSEKTGIKYTSPADYRSVICVRRIF